MDTSTAQEERVREERLDYPSDPTPPPVLPTIIMRKHGLGRWLLETENGVDPHEVPTTLRVIAAQLERKLSEIG